MFCVGSNPACGMTKICDHEDLTMAPAGNKAKHLSSVNHTTKTIHHHHHALFLLILFRCLKCKFIDMHPVHIFDLP